jgi:signal transduction histidine kinase
LTASIAADGDLLIVATDNGIGIAPDDIERVMEPFGQADSHLNRKYEGTGLGLPLARGLAELHGGKLTLESRLNVGTTVTVRLPAFRVHAAARASTPRHDEEHASGLPDNVAQLSAARIPQKV